MDLVGKSGAEAFRVPLPPSLNNDSAVEAAAKKGVTIHAEISSGVALPTGAARTSFLGNVYNEVQRYGYGGQFWAEHSSLPYRPITTWEVWNEPNGSGIGAAEYGVFLGEVANTIQAASQAKAGRGTNVVFGGLLVWGNSGKGEKGSVTYTGAMTYLEEAYPYIAANPNVTGIAIHPYELNPETFHSGLGRIQAFEYAVRGFHNVLVELAELTGHPQKSLWITEAGWPAEGEYSVGLEGQATLLKQAIDFARANAGTLNLGDFLWYNLRDAGNSAIWQNRCGIISRNGSYRPAWYVFQQETGAPQWPVEAHPSVVLDPSNGLASVWRGTDGNLYETVAPKGTWTTFSPTWGNLPAGVTPVGNPSALVDPYNGLSATWRGSNGNLYETVAVSGKWTTFSPTWGNLPGTVQVASDPDTVYEHVNGINDVWRGTDGNIYDTVAVSGKWTTFSPTWENLPAGVSATGKPSAIYDPSNGLSVTWRGTDGNIYDTVAVSGKWTTFSPTWGNLPSGVKVSGDPEAVYDPSNGLTVIWRGTDGNIYETTSSGGKWTTFSPTWNASLPVAVSVLGEPSVIDDPTNGITIVWEGTDGNLYETVAPKGTWTTFSPTWETLPSGVKPTGVPGLMIDPSNGLSMTWRGGDGSLYETVAPGGKWTTFSPTWGALGGGLEVAK
jgi:hypothetical protein